MSDPHGATYYGDGSRYSAGQQRAMEREAEEQEAVTARAVAWLMEGQVGHTAMCVYPCNKEIDSREYERHASTCRALRREVE